MARGHPKTERNEEIWRKYLEGARQVDLAEEFGISQTAVSDIIMRKRCSFGPEDKAQILADIVAETQRSRAALIEIRDEDIPPAFDVKGSILRNNRGDIVRDHTQRLAAMKELGAQDTRTARVLGLNAPDRSVIDQTVHFVIGGVDEGDV